MPRPIYKIAEDIRKDWKKPSRHAEPYLKAMEELGSINDQYIFESAKDIVLYFLANAQSWKGETARKIKKELNSL